MITEYSGATTEFPTYNLTQMIRHSTPHAPSQSRRYPEVPETTAQQDDIIRGIAATEEEELAQQEGMIKSDPSDGLTAQTRTIGTFLRCLHDDMTMRPVALV